MKYYLIAGEASGDLHASRLMAALSESDRDAQFRFFGGDLMTSVGGTCVKHYREMAYMGFIPVLLHLRTIFRNMALCKSDIVAWQPDVVIFVDYPGFNLKIAQFLHQHTNIPAFYYIAPKLWAWKEYRIKNIKRDISKLFSILPFEKEFFEGKHHYPIHYVGNPTAEEVREFLATEEARTPLPELSDDQRPVVALLAGSRRQEIKDNLPAMLEAAGQHPGYQYVIAGAPSIEASFYEPYLRDNKDVKIVYNKTYPLLSQSIAALVTSGTATLETAMFRVPQVVCYKTPLPHLFRFAFEHVIKCRFISLVNLIADREIVQELMCERFSIAEISHHLGTILPGGSARETMLRDYEDVHHRLGNMSAPHNAAKAIIEALRK